MPSLGEFAQGTDAEIFNPYTALQAWAGSPADESRRILNEPKVADS
jgi:hypothetical protein